ncbi:hypothetical protein PVAND_011216 [Polypedilum vanderplanki]|uniref:Uncharacterized protein n=1 Tax=Polypedilum vanderplanki TaxID=319348 RepID=A0A9J6CIT4_POLVA|nr:hypothetical protein PVAND_011216 [Polypedilum vanderplanki]
MTTMQLLFASGNLFHACIIAAKGNSKGNEGNFLLQQDQRLLDQKLEKRFGNAVAIPIDLQQLPVVSYKNFISKDEAINKILNDEFKDRKNLIIRIEEELNQNTNLSKINNALKNQQIIALQSKNDGKFFINWKFQNEIYGLKIFDNLEDLEELCKFIVEFLSKCLDQNHSGITNSANENMNLALSSLIDKDGLNLFFNAAQIGNTKVVKILLECAFNVNCLHNRLFAVDYAYKNQHYETVFELLNLNSMFPAELDIDACPEKLKEFAEMSKKFHENIQSGNIEEVSQTLTKYPNLRYFYSPGNLSACAMAIGYRQFEIYELLICKNVYLSAWEEIEELTSHLSKQERKELREIHFRNKKDIQESHIMNLMSKSSVGHDVFDIQDKLDHVAKAFRILNNFLAIQILLKIAALLSDLQMIFDFNRESVEYLDPTSDRGTLGLFYGNGRIYVGAKQLLDPKTEHEVFATIAHELCHFVLYNVFGSNAWPYDENDKETAEEFEVISQECKLKKSVDKIISLVYDCYPSDMFHAELIVRIPHFFAYYHNKPEIIEMLRIEFNSLFNFYEFNLISKLETQLIRLKSQLENERKANERRISMLLKIMCFGFISLISLACFVGYYFYEPNYSWSELSKEQKEKIYDGVIKFEKQIMKFRDLYDENDSNEVYRVLKPQQIKKLLKNEFLDLNETENSFLLAPPYLEIIHGKTVTKYCCNWANVQVMNRFIKSFELPSGTKIQTNVARIHPKYRNDKVEEFTFGNWCDNNNYCTDRSNIKYLPVSIYKAFPNLITYKTQQYAVSHLRRDNFKNLKKLHNLDLFDNLIETIDADSFVDLIELKYFFIGKNKIQYIDQNLFKYNIKLEYLNFLMNKITTVSAEHFNRLINLNELSLCDNKLTKVDSNLFESLISLKLLHLCINRLNSLPSNIFINLVNLTYIDLSKNQLTTLDENIFISNINLKNLELGTNKISNLSSKILDSNSNLAHVDLRGNPCINIEYGKKENLNILLTSDEKAQLKKVIHENCLNYTELIEGKYAIEKCCEWSKDVVIDRNIQVFQINTDTKILTETSQIRKRYQSDEVEVFKILNWCNGYCVDRSNIQLLPIRINEIFPNLIAYYARFYEVRRLKKENFRNLRKLQYLDLFDNLIETIDEDAFEDLVELKNLFLTNNRISFLHTNQFKNNLKVIELNFYMNQITSVTQQHFGHLINLRIFTLCNNNLTELDPNMFDTLINIEAFFVCGNQLKTISTNIFKRFLNLTDVSLATNQFTTLDENIFINNNKIKKLELWNNKITKLSSKIFDNKPYLAYVNLGGNFCIQKDYGNKDNLQTPLTEELKIRLKKDVDENCS